MSGCPSLLREGQEGKLLRVRAAHFSVVLLTLVCVALATGGAAPLRAQSIAYFGAMTCESPGQAATAALDPTEPRVVATCRATFDDGMNAAPPASLPSGRLSFTVDGPALIVESGGGRLDIDCDDSAAVPNCPGDPAAAADPGNQLTVHIALMPGAALPVLPEPGAIGVHVSYQPNAADFAASVSTLIDIVQPAYQLTLGTDHNVIGSGSHEMATITARLERLVPVACAALGAGPWLVCNAQAPDMGATGVEPGIITFTTTIGAFPNLEQRIPAVCGDTEAASPPLVVPPLEQSRGYLSSCAGASVRLSPFGLGGDAVVSATFSGRLTGSGASNSTTITIAPQALSIDLPRGCTEVTVPAGVPPNSPVTLIVETVTPSSAVAGVWRRGDGGGWQLGYQRDGDPVLDFDTVQPGDALSICVDASASFPLG